MSAGTGSLLVNGEAAVRSGSRPAEEEEGEEYKLLPQHQWNTPPMRDCKERAFGGAEVSGDKTPFACIAGARTHMHTGTHTATCRGFSRERQALVLR